MGVCVWEWGETRHSSFLYEIEKREEKGGGGGSTEKHWTSTALGGGGRKIPRPRRKRRASEEQRRSRGQGAWVQGVFAWEHLLPSPVCNTRLQTHRVGFPAQCYLLVLVCTATCWGHYWVCIMMFATFLVLMKQDLFMEPRPAWYLGSFSLGLLSARITGL